MTLFPPDRGQWRGWAGRSPGVMNAPLAVAGSALLWVVSGYLNNDVAFAWAEESRYRRWIFVPAGIKLILCMILGWHGALGVTLGILFNLHDYIPTAGAFELAAFGIALGFSPLVSVAIFSRWTGISHPWFGIQGHHLVALTMLSAALCAASFHGLLIAFGIETSEQALVQGITMMTGDFIGAGLLLLTIAAVRVAIRYLRGERN